MAVERGGRRKTEGDDSVLGFVVVELCGTGRRKGWAVQDERVEREKREADSPF